MKNAEATPRPWDYVPSTEHHGPYITSEFGSTIADLYLMTQPGQLSVRNGGASEPIHFLHEMADPNAELIVRAVNAHDALVAALERMVAERHEPSGSAVQQARTALLLAKRGASACASPRSPTEEPTQ